MSLDPSLTDRVGAVDLKRSLRKGGPREKSICRRKPKAGNLARQRNLIGLSHERAIENWRPFERLSNFPWAYINPPFLQE